MFGKDEERDADFDQARSPTRRWSRRPSRLWREQVAGGPGLPHGHHDLGTAVDLDGDDVEVRDILVHMVEEYARHCGHADLLRECIDGRTGQ